MIVCKLLPFSLLYLSLWSPLRRLSWSCLLLFFFLYVVELLSFVPFELLRFFCKLYQNRYKPGLTMMTFSLRFLIQLTSIIVRILNSTFLVTICLRFLRFDELRTHPVACTVFCFSLCIHVSIIHTYHLDIFYTHMWPCVFSIAWTLRLFPPTCYLSFIPVWVVRTFLHARSTRRGFWSFG